MAAFDAVSKRTQCSSGAKMELLEILQRDFLRTGKLFDTRTICVTLRSTVAASFVSVPRGARLYTPTTHCI